MPVSTGGAIANSGVARLPAVSRMSSVTASPQRLRAGVVDAERRLERVTRQHRLLVELDLDVCADARLAGGLFDGCSRSIDVRGELDEHARETVVDGSIGRGLERIEQIAERTELDEVRVRAGRELGGLGDPD